jgi:hypothetical protein
VASEVGEEGSKLRVAHAPGRLVEIGFEVVEDEDEAAAVQGRDQVLEARRDRPARVAQDLLIPLHAGIEERSSRGLDEAGRVDRLADRRVVARVARLGRDRDRAEAVSLELACEAGGERALAGTAKAAQHHALEAAAAEYGEEALQLAPPAEPMVRARTCS